MRARLAPAPPSARARGLGWLVAIVLVVRALLLAAPAVAGLIITTSLFASVIEDERLRLAIGAVLVLGVPLLLRARLSAFLKKRTRVHAPRAVWFVTVGNLAFVAAACFGFADDVGRALRRHGDWFVGEERHGAVARGYRGAVIGCAGWLERFDPPPELAAVVLPPDLTDVPAGPWRPGEEPETKPLTLEWFHPLAGPRRALPISEGRRFGAARPQPRPPECELGHCGVDVGGTIGEPVFAAFDGTVERIERDEERGGRAGRYVRIGHKSGTVVTRYIHLDSIRADLKEGDHVKGGEVIGRLGRSGVFHSGPHLHFGLSLRPSGPGGAETYVDPEPLLRTWKLPDATALAGARMAAR